MSRAETTVNGWPILMREGDLAIVDTPAYPARYYAGYLNGGRLSCNDTAFFHRTESAALDAFCDLAAAKASERSGDHDLSSRRALPRPSERTQPVVRVPPRGER